MRNLKHEGWEGHVELFCVARAVGVEAKKKNKKERKENTKKKKEKGEVPSSKYEGWEGEVALV